MSEFISRPSKPLDSRISPFESSDLEDDSVHWRTKFITGSWNAAMDAALFLCKGEYVVDSAFVLGGARLIEVRAIAADMRWRKTPKMEVSIVRSASAVDDLLVFIVSLPAIGQAIANTKTAPSTKKWGGGGRARSCAGKVTGGKGEGGDDDPGRK
jgi:hypothetical protein